jgi:hypothetical protein
VTLAIATNRMARRGVIVRRLPAVEGLGSCTLIASDKTGTLTCNELTVRRICLPNGDEFEVTGEGFAPIGQVLFQGRAIAPDRPSLNALARATVLCNEADLHHRDRDWVWRGDPTDIALLSMAHKLGWNREAALNLYPQVNEIPFEPEHKFAATYHTIDGVVRVLVKGAPERVLMMCDLPPDAKVARQLQAIAQQMAEQGYRVLALAEGIAPAALTPSQVPPEPCQLTLLGFVGVIDPLRSGVREAIATCHSVGTVSFAAFRWAIDAGWSESSARNALLLLMVLFENIQIANSRSEVKSAFRLSPWRNPILLIGTAAAFLIHVAMLYLPLGQTLLYTQPVEMTTWLVLVSIFQFFNRKKINVLTSSSYCFFTMKPKLVRWRLGFRKDWKGAKSMKWMQKNQFIKISLLVLLALLLWGTATAQTQVESKDIVRIGSDLTIAEKQVVRDATAIAGSVIVLKEGHVTGDAVAVGGDVVLKTGARVDGDVSAIGGEIFKEEGVSVGGDTVTVFSGDQEMIQTIRQWGLGGLLARAYLFSAAFHGVAILAIATLGILLMLLVPNFLQTITETIRQTPLKSGAWGLGGAIALLLLGILIAGSLLGTLVLPIINLVALVAGLLGTIAMGLLIGERTLWQRTAMPQFLVGMLILGLVGLIPVIGAVFLLAVNLFGFGGVLVSQWESRRWQRRPEGARRPENLEPTRDRTQEV